METRLSDRASPAKASRTNAESCEVSGIPAFMLPQGSGTAGRGLQELPRPFHTLFHRLSRVRDQPIAIFELMGRDGEGRAESHRDGTGAEERKPFRPQDVPCASDADRHAIEPARQSRHRRAFLERKHLVGSRTGAFGKEEESHSAQALFEPRRDRLRRPVRIAAIDEDVSHALGAPPEERNLPELVLRHEAHRARSARHDGGHVHVRGVVGDEDVALAGIERNDLRDDAGPGAKEDEPAPGAQDAVRERPVARNADHGRRHQHSERDDREADRRAKDSSDHERPGSLASGYSSAAGKSSTSAIEAAPVRSIRSRSNPIATPPAPGMRSSASRNRSSSGHTPRPSRARSPCSSSSRERCSRASVNSENPFASSRPAAYSSNRSATRGSEGFSRASAACDAG